MADGLKSIVAELAGAPERPSAGEQPDMFGEPDKPQPLKPVAAPGPQGGRPAGVRNKSTEWWKTYLLGRYVHPVEALLQIASRSPRELAEELELFARDPETGGILRDAQGQPLLQHDALRQAFDRQQAALVAAAPYLMQRQPLAVAITERKLGKMTMVFGGAGGGSHAISPARMKPMPNQRVSEAHVVGSDDASAQHDANALSDKDNPNHEG